MKILPSALAAHLAGGATTLAWCWRITRSDGITFGFTDHDRTLSFDGTDFEREAYRDRVQRVRQGKARAHHAVQELGQAAERPTLLRVVLSGILGRLYRSRQLTLAWD